MEFFDRMLGVYTQTTREKQLELLAPEPSPVRQALLALDQLAPAKRYAENTTNSMLVQAGRSPVRTRMRWMRKPPPG